MNIIAYTYEADTHCIADALARFGQEPGRSWVLEGAVDSEGNPVHPIFSTDEWCEPSDEVAILACGTCHDIIEQHEHSRLTDCIHEHVEQDDDGLARRFWVCLDCDQEVYPVQTEDGTTEWETA